MSEKFIYENILKYKDNKKNLDKLTDIYQRNGIIPFIGAGLSSPFGFKLWKDFLVSCCKSKITENYISDLLENDKYEEAAEFLYIQDKQYFEQRLHMEYHDKEIDEKTFFNSAISLLPKIFKGPVVTTNFDRIIEMAYKKYERNIKNINILQPDKFYSSLAERNECLFKIHGDVNDFQSIVITKEQYDRRYSGNIEFKYNFGTFIKTNTFLFLGCSLKQDRTMMLILENLKELEENYHYALVASPALSPKGIHIANKQQEEDEISQRLKNFHIIPIWFPDGKFEYINYYLKKISKWDFDSKSFSKRLFYISSIKDHYESLDSIKNYVPLCGSCCYLNGTQISEDDSSEIDLSALLAEHHKIIILGEPGSGKTTTIERFVLKFATLCENDMDAPLPLFIKLSKWVESDFESFLQNVWENIYHMDGSIRTLLEDREVVLFLDGLNEIGDNINEKADKIFDWISENNKIYIVITCRTIEYKNHNSKLKSFPYIQLLPMNDNQVNEFIEKTLGNRKNIFLEQLDIYTKAGNEQKSTQDISMTNIFVDITKNPFLLHAVIEYFKLNNEKATYNPYEIANVLIRKKWTRPYVSSKYNDISYEDVEIGLSKLAYHIVKNDLNISIQYDNEEKIINNEIIEAAFFAELIELQGNLITFRHQIFLEYFASIELCNIGILSIIEEPNILFMDYGSKTYDPTVWPFYNPIPSRWQIPIIFSLGKYVHEKNEIESIMYKIIKKNVFVAITCMLATSFIDTEAIRKWVRYIIDDYENRIGALQVLDKLSPLIQDIDLIEKIDINSVQFHPSEAIIIMISKRGLNSANVINILLKLLDSLENGLIHLETNDLTIRISIRIVYTLGAIGNADVINTLLQCLNNHRVTNVSCMSNIRPMSYQAYFSIIRIARREPYESTNILLDSYNRNWEYHIKILKILYNFNSCVPLDFYFKAMDDSSSDVRGLALDIIAHKFGRIYKVVERFIMAIEDENDYYQCIYHSEEDVNKLPHNHYEYVYSENKNSICFEALKNLIEWEISFSNRKNTFLKACKVLSNTRSNFYEYDNIVSKFMKINKQYDLSEQEKNLFEEYTSNIEKRIYEENTKEYFVKWKDYILQK